jgi:phosphatidylethanolamine N-methyltransferase
MESEIRNRKATAPSVESVVDNGVSTANRHHASTAASNHDSNNGTRDSSEDLSLNHSLSDSQKQSLAREQEEAAFGKTPNGTSTSISLLVAFAVSSRLHVCSIQRQ